MANLLVIYGSTHGQSAKIAGAIARELSRAGHHPTLVDSAAAGAPDPALFDAVIVGASVHASGYQRSLVRWVQRHAAVLSTKPTAFYSVCLGVLQPEAEVQHAERKIVEDFFRRTGWRPGAWTLFAGALTYSKMNFLMRWMMRRIARKAGGGTDTRRDYEYTDWHAVDAFAREFAARCW